MKACQILRRNQYQQYGCRDEILSNEVSTRSETSKTSRHEEMKLKIRELVLIVAVATVLSSLYEHCVRVLHSVLVPRAFLEFECSEFGEIDSANG